MVEVQISEIVGAAWCAIYVLGTCAAIWGWCRLWTGQTKKEMLMGAIVECIGTVLCACAIFS